MPSETDEEITELVELRANKVSAVHGPANGTPFLLLKAAACSACGGTGMVDGEKCSKCDTASKGESEDIQAELTKGDGDLSGDESTDMENTVTKEQALAYLKARFCGNPACAVCEPLFTKAKLKSKARGKLPASDFADPKGRKLPMHDEPHVRNALSRLNQTDTVTPKAEVASRLRSRAKSMGIEVGDDTAAAKDVDDVRGTVDAKRVGQQAAKMSPGVPAAALATPQEKGHEPSFGQSGKRVQPMASDLKPMHSDPAFAYGGESPYAIVGEGKVNIAPPVNPRKQVIPPEAEGNDNNIAVNKVQAVAVASLMEAIDRIAAQRQTVAKDGTLPWLTQDNSAAVTQPGSAPWESLDSATLSQVAEQLAGACAALDAIQKREAIEALNGDPGDYQDAADLSAAQDTLDSALGIVARLAFHEGASANGVSKVGRAISRKTQAALENARDHLNDVLGRVTDIDPQASHGAGAKGKKKTNLEEVLDMGTVTKEELAESVATAAREAVKQQGKEAAKKARAEKKAKKAAKKSKAEKKAARAKKEQGISGIHANVTEGEERGAVRGENDANDVNSIPNGGDVKPEYANKAAAAELEEMKKSLEEQQKTISKLAKMARRGGPVLDGQPRGAFPASEGRTGENVAKSAADENIEKLEKSLEEELGKTGPEHAQRASDIGYQLTLARLKKQHEGIYGEGNPLATAAR